MFWCQPLLILGWINFIQNYEQKSQNSKMINMWHSLSLMTLFFVGHLHWPFTEFDEFNKAVVYPRKSRNNCFCSLKLLQNLLKSDEKWYTSTNSNYLENPFLFVCWRIIGGGSENASNVSPSQHYTVLSNLSADFCFPAQFLSWCLTCPLLIPGFRFANTGHVTWILVSDWKMSRQGGL